jgi:hypothetical protein
VPGEQTGDGLRGGRRGSVGGDHSEHQVISGFPFCLPARPDSGRALRFRWQRFSLTWVHAVSRSSCRASLMSGSFLQGS